MSAFGILHIAEVEEPLGFSVQFSHFFQFFRIQAVVRHRLGDPVLQRGKAVADLRFPPGHLGLDLTDPGCNCFSAAMAFSALGQQRFAVQRADQVMVMILRAAFRGLDRHMAVRAAQDGGMPALQVGLQFRMLCLEHLCAGSRLLPVVEAHRVVISQNRFRRHLRHAVVGHHGFAVFRGKIVFNMALAAGQ